MLLSFQIPNFEYFRENQFLNNFDEAQILNIFMKIYFLNNFVKIRNKFVENKLIEYIRYNSKYEIFRYDSN